MGGHKGNHIFIKMIIVQNEVFVYYFGSIISINI